MPPCEMDIRPGGALRFCMRSPEGRDYWWCGVYREVVEPTPRQRFPPLVPRSPVPHAPGFSQPPLRRGAPRTAVASPFPPGLDRDTIPIACRPAVQFNPFYPAGFPRETGGYLRWGHAG